MTITQTGTPVPRRIRHLQALAGLSDRQLGDLTGMSRERVEARLTLKRKPTAITANEVALFADALGVPVDVLYIDDDSQFLHRIADLAAVTLRNPETAVDLLERVPA